MAALIKKLNSSFLKGFLALLPIGLTVSLIIWILQSLEGAFGTILITVLPEEFYIPGLGLLLAIIAILGTGLLVEKHLAGRLLVKFEMILKKAPLIRTIYSPLKDLTDLFSRAKGPDHSQEVVFVRISPTIELLGLTMRENFQDLPKVKISEGTIAVFVPFSYGFGGYTVLVKKDSVREAGISAERALQLAITGWVGSGH